MTRPRGKSAERKPERKPAGKPGPAAKPSSAAPDPGVSEAAGTRLHRTIPVLPSTDLARSVEFWAERLGFAMSFRFADSAGVIRDDVEVHFRRWKDQGAPAEGECRIEVDDLTAVQRELVAQGIAAPEAARGEPLLELTVQDPDGNRITFAGGGTI